VFIDQRSRFEAETYSNYGGPQLRLPHSFSQWELGIDVAVTALSTELLSHPNPPVQLLLTSLCCTSTPLPSLSLCHRSHSLGCILHRSGLCPVEENPAFLFGAAPLLPRPASTFAYAFPSTSPSAQSGATSILLDYTPHSFLTPPQHQSVNCRSSRTFDIV
jgi:hypothetical protein